MSKSSPRLELNEQIILEGDNSIPQPNFISNDNRDWSNCGAFQDNLDNSEDERKIRKLTELSNYPRKSKSRQKHYPKNPPSQQLAELYGTPAYAQHYQRTQQCPFVGASQGVSLVRSTCATTASSKANGEKLSSSRQLQVIQQQLHNLPK
ncbi:Hypothetical predicted protein [Mytilus galloprovincialis]|uniref:Uncharacterized protein n=1 Tax=Mytilus galloprovincialis TaxID=29158 RepID=A0A8B6D575_MYTGA|nr:Hypothetical predicted protein [Mytilus galloprovincialis]